MSAKLIKISALVLAIAGGGYWLYHKLTAEAQPEYRFVAVERGDLTAAVSATGTLSAVTTVQVGTQVSGQISNIYADFNDQVKKGQLIAQIDPTLQQQAVQDAEANLERAQVELERSQVEYERNQRLFENKVLTEVEFNVAKYAYGTARATVKSAAVALARARRNLQYTSILSPVDGIIVERTVDVGQTVAASYSTPQLFLIAQDLSKMQILAAVDESDIGRIERGQPVSFTVQAYPNRTFEGRVEQVRLQSKTQENVVNYTVAVSVDNSSGKLLPGMTATVEFLTGSASNILLVPNTALRFRPPEALLARMREERSAARGGGARAQQPPAAGPGGGGNGFGGYAGSARRRGNDATDRGRLWHLDDKGELAAITVRTGITDGQKTQIEGSGIEAGMQVIIGVVQMEQSGASAFSPQTPSGPTMRRTF